MDFKEQPTLSWKMHLQLILLMHVHTGIPLKHTKGLYCLSPQVLGMELRSPLNSSPKTHLGAASCYRLRPRSDAVSESAALLRSSHRLSSPRRNPLFERDVRSNRRSNSLYLAAPLGGLRCLWGQRLFNTLVPTLLDDYWSYGNSYNPANCSNQNRKRLETIGRLSWFDYCDLPLVVFGRKERKNSVVFRQTKTKSNPMIKVTLEVSSKVNFGFRW